MAVLKRRAPRSAPTSRGCGSVTRVHIQRSLPSVARARGQSQPALFADPLSRADPADADADAGPPLPGSCVLAAAVTLRGDRARAAPIYARPIPGAASASPSRL